MRNLIPFITILLTIAVSLCIGVQRYKSTPEAAEASRNERQEPAPQEGGETREMAAPAQTAPAQAPPPPPSPLSSIQGKIPHIGRIQVLNGCGCKNAEGTGAGVLMANFLQSKQFNVIGTPRNATSSNYPATMIISRTSDMTVANEIEKYLKTGNVVLIRDSEQEYDVTVIVGPDFEEKIR